MSLLSEAYDTSFVIMDKKTVSDGVGGVITEWQEGAPIKAALVKDESMQAKIAETQGVTAVYTITTERSVKLRYHDVLKRKNDGKIFRVTSNGDDKATPKSATLDMRQVSAEDWRLES